MAKNWLSSPFGIDLLLKLYGKQVGKCFNIFENVSKVLKNKKEFVIKNKLFLASDNKGDYFSEMNVKFNLEMEAFTSCQEAYIALKNWVNQYEDFQQFKPEKYNSSNAEALLTNICMYKGAWKSSMVKVHNSFSYTEDIKYEVRVLVVTMSDEDIEFAIVVPNETDVLCHLVKKLHKEGLSAALNTIQPAFTATCKQTLPNFQFNSNITLPAKYFVEPEGHFALYYVVQSFLTNEWAVKCENHFSNLNSTEELEDPKLMPSQYGSVRVDQTGIDMKVLTCLDIGNGTMKIDNDKPRILNDCFSFAIVCKDVPLFSGQVPP